MPASSFSRILVVDDDPPLRHMLELLLTRADFEVQTVASAEQALVQLDNTPVDVVLTDVRMPGTDGLTLTERLHDTHPELTIVVMSAFGSIELALEAMRRGAYDYISKPFKRDEVVLTLRKAEERLRLRRENAGLRARVAELEGEGPQRLGRLLVHSPGMRKLAATVTRLARFETTVLVLGESGVGKELISRALHELGPRAAAPFVAVNCGAIPEALIESELFGHARGAFTDARSDKPGLFEAADGGSLFLDEVGELPVQVQVKLLRALQEREVRRLGETGPRAVDVRVIAATSRPLEQMVESGEFRRDLYYRLAVMPLRIPALRERREDIVPLAEDILTAINDRLGTRCTQLSDDTRRLLLAYDWPGNVRELENTLEHAAVLTEGETIAPEALPERLHQPARDHTANSGTHADPGASRFSLAFSTADLSVKRAQRRIERELILRALAETGGNRSHAAKLLDLSNRALSYKIKDFDLD